LCDGFDATEISWHHKQDKPYLPTWERPHTEETSRRQQKRSQLLWFFLRVAPIPPILPPWPAVDYCADTQEGNWHSICTALHASGKEDGIWRKQQNKEAEAKRGRGEGGEANMQSIKKFSLGWHDLS
jgi:hypothetical protein